MSKNHKPTARQIAANNNAIQAAAREIEKNKAGGPQEVPQDHPAFTVKPISKVGVEEVAKAIRAIGKNNNELRAYMEFLHVEDGAMVATNGVALITCARPAEIASGDYPLTKRSEEHLKKNCGTTRFPNWRLIVPTLGTAGGYKKAGEIANGGRGLAVVNCATTRNLAAGDVYFRIGNVVIDPYWTRSLLSSMFKLGAERVEVWTCGWNKPVVLVGKSGKFGRIVGVQMYVRFDGVRDEREHAEHLGKCKFINMEFDAPTPADAKPAKVEEKPAPAAPAAPAAPEAVEPSPYADHLAEWRKLTHDNEHTGVRLAISKWCEANAKSERDEFASIADDFAYILSTTDGDTMTPELCDFRMDLTDELMQRIGRVFGKEAHAAIMGTL